WVSSKSALARGIIRPLAWRRRPRGRGKSREGPKCRWLRLDSMTVAVSSISSPKIASDITQLVGHTPMLQLVRVAPDAAAVFAKLEFLNPGGSIKDRAALGMILDAEARGLLHAGSTILEATAGNTGVGLALIGVNRGYTVKLFVPEGFAEEKCILMRGFGAEVVRTPEAEG